MSREAVVWNSCVYLVSFVIRYNFNTCGRRYPRSVWWYQIYWEVARAHVCVIMWLSCLVRMRRPCAVVYSSVFQPFYGKTPEVNSISRSTTTCENVHRPEKEEEVGSERKWLKCFQLPDRISAICRGMLGISHLKVFRYSMISCGTHIHVLRDPGCETAVYSVKGLNAARVVTVGEVWHSFCIMWSPCKDRFRAACCILCIVRAVELCKWTLRQEGCTEVKFVCTGYLERTFPLILLADCFFFYEKPAWLEKLMITWVI